MVFSRRPGRYAEEPALIESAASRTWSYAELRAEVEALSARLPEMKSLAFNLCRNGIPSILAYLACLRRGHAVAMLDADASPEIVQSLIARYQPDLVLAPADDEARPPWAERYLLERTPSGVALWRRFHRSAVRPHPALSVLLSTSGTTGSPRLVRLSLANVEANADSIAQYLELGPGERALATLPIHYSYGLSVLNSHLISGGCVVLPEEGLLRPNFWKAAALHRCTSLAGVPYTFQMLTRIGFEGFSLPSLRTLTQAGGHMSKAAVLQYDALMKSRGGRLFVMYGQTEATARMAYLPPDRLPEKAGSVGVAVPGGSLSISAEGGRSAPPGEQGEVVYRGPNVMLGYAERLEDLALGDTQGGVLATGDLGHLDDEGFLHITGRRNRYSKVFGLRINLDEVESRLRGRGPTAVAAAEDRIVVFCEYGDDVEHESLRMELSRFYGINLNAFEFRKVPALPLKASGKVDYARLDP